uniref:Ferroptosis suppressor protein 1 n=1 Tax=Ciona savignyi TaxID=51511 RepID=H2Z7T6_CIOSA
MGSGNSVPVKDGMHVVIVGGGYAGSSLAVYLVKKKFCKVTLIDPRDAMFNNIGALRGVAYEEYTKYVFLPHDEMVGDSFVKGVAESLDLQNKTVTLKDGKTVNYTHLVIATGTRSPFPSKISGEYPEASTEEATKLFKDYRDQIKSAKRIVLVGGGAVGVELAGELKTAFPDKEITIVTSSNHLVTTRSKPGFQKKLNETLRHKNITVLFGERVSNIGSLPINQYVKDQVVTTESGKEIAAELVIPCTGTKINKEFYQEALADAMTPHGALEVNEYFEVKGHGNVLAIGDVTAIDEEKMAFLANIHAECVAKNLIAEVKGTKKQPYKPVFGGSLTIMVPVGRLDGVAQINGMVFGSLFVRLAKGDDLLAGKLWKQYGLKKPK